MFGEMQVYTAHENSGCAQAKFEFTALREEGQLLFIVIELPSLEVTKVSMNY